MNGTFENVTIILPTLNEAANIADLVKTIAARYPGVQILVVDDDSCDATPKIVKFLALKTKSVRFLSRKGKPRGLTASIIDGLNATKTTFAIVMDGDGQHPPEKVTELIDSLESGYDIVVACRSSVPGWSVHRQLISRGADVLGRCRLLASSSSSCADIMSGFFGIRRDYFLHIYAHHGRRFVPSGYKFLFDLLKSCPKNTKIGEIVYVFGTRKGGASKIGSRQCMAFVKSLFR